MKWSCSWYLFALTSQLCAPYAASSPPPAASQPSDPRLMYDLSEKCGRDSREWFKHFYGDGRTSDSDSSTMSGYTNHYNTKLNKCFALLEGTGTLHDVKTRKTRVSDSRQLVDVNENRDTASYFRFLDMDRTMMCSLGEKVCGSLQEWQSLVAPYMEQ